MDWKAYFEMMKDWKKLPAYRAEPRIDSLVGYFLPQFIAEFLGIGRVEVIPEFPIRLGTVNKDLEKTNYADRSYKVDFLIIGGNGKNYLVEFKTDSGSRREEQDTYLDHAKTEGTKLVIEGVLKIADASSYKKKYGHLIDKLKDFGLLNSENDYSGKNPSFEVVYVQPKPNGADRVIDFEWISNWLERNFPNSEFELEFARALKEWAKD